MYVKGKK